MPLPVALAPIASVAVRYTTVALATYAIARQVERGRRDQPAEDALDRLDEGVSLRREGEQVNATGRFRRVIRPRAGGPGVEIDISGITRIRLRKVD